MSVQAMAECWGKDFPVESDSEVSPQTVRLVALAVADVVNDTNDNEYYGSVTRLAEKVCLTRETVGLAIKHLVGVGVLTVVEERLGYPTRYRWMGIPRHPLHGGDGNSVRGGGDGTLRQGGDGTLRQGVTERSVTNPIEPKSEPKETQTPAGAGVVLLGVLGEDPDKEASTEGKAPSRIVVEHFLSSWYDMVSLRKIHMMVPRVPNRLAAYKYLNTNFFQPKEGGPFPVSSVIAMIDDFINKVEYGNIEVKGNAWSTFVFYANRLNTQPQDTYTSSTPTTIEELWEKYGSGVDEPSEA